MKKTTERNWRILISFLCLFVWLGVFMNFVRISLPAGSSFSGAILEKAGIRNGRLTFSLYRILRGILSVEYDWSLVGTPARELYIVIFVIVVPYILVLAVAVLAWIRGRWKYAVMAGLSLLAVFDMIYGILIRMPAVLGAWLEELIGSRMSWLVGLAMDEPLSDFLQKNMVSYLGEGFWCSIALLALIYLLSMILFAVSWRSRSR